MKKPDRSSLHLLQLLRGVAALMVVVLHGSTVVTERFGSRQEIWWNGAAGVDVFFVISGFVMAFSSRSLVSGSSPEIEFIKRRFERIVPLYWIFTTLKIGLVLATPVIALRGLGGWWHVLSSYLFLPSRDTRGVVLPVLSVGWTLNFEMLFYLLFAVALALKVRPVKMLTPILVAMALIPIVVTTNSSALLSWCHPIVLEFLFGMLVYEFWSRNIKLPTAAVWVGLSLGVLTIFLIPWGWNSLLRPLVWGLPAFAIVGAAIELEGTIGRKAPRWLLEIGDASYSIYLTHVFVLPLMAAGLLRLPLPILRTMVPVILMSIVLSVTAGVLVYRGIELPIIRYFRTRRSNTRSVAV